MVAGGESRGVIDGRGYIYKKGINHSHVTTSQTLPGEVSAGQFLENWRKLVFKSKIKGTFRLREIHRFLSSFAQSGVTS